MFSGKELRFRGAAFERDPGGSKSREEKGGAVRLTFWGGPEESQTCRDFADPSD